jgi:hypothetical protein
MTVGGPSGLPSVPETALPPDVRAGSKADKETFQAAMGFETMLVGQLLKTSFKTGPLAEGPWADTVRDSMSDAITQGGGLGMSRSLYEAMRAAEGRR